MLLEAPKTINHKAVGGSGRWKACNVSEIANKKREIQCCSSSISVQVH